MSIYTALLLLLLLMCLLLYLFIYFSEMTNSAPAEHLFAKSFIFYLGGNRSFMDEFHKDCEEHILKIKMHK